MAMHIWLLLFLATLSASSDPNTSKVASSNRNQTNTDGKDRQGTSFAFSSVSPELESHGEVETAHDNDSTVTDEVIVDDGGGASVFETKKGTKRKAEVTTEDSSGIPMADSRFEYLVTGSDVTALRNYIASCDNCMVDWGGFRCPLSDPAQELKKWILELQKLLSFGCQLGDHCGAERKCCYGRDPTIERALEQTTTMARQMYSMFQEACSNCPRNGGWSDWGTWSTCSVTCDTGSRTRCRSCTRPPPRGAGRACVGAAQDSEMCNGPICCVHGGWSEWCGWGQCSATCGTGMQERRRMCSNPAPNDCGRTCPGSDVDFRQCHSPFGPCCVNGNWGTWGSWSSCFVTCGTCRRERRRQCDSPPPNHCGRDCVGDRVESRVFMLPECPQDPQACGWSSWDQWSACDRTCGNGTRSRSRECRRRGDLPCQCPGTDQETGPCAPLPPCEHPQWAAWEDWCACDCGRGVSVRHRRCTTSPSGPPVDVILCGGNSRQEKPCDVRESCPGCLREGDCAGRVDGLYPSSISCRHYVRCSKGQMQVYQCTKPGTEWDHYNSSCAAGPSPSCSLAQCVTDCHEREKGRYPSCRGCGYFLECPGDAVPSSCPAGHEFNSHQQQCMSGRSPTCTIPQQFGGRGNVPIQDAPADRYLVADRLSEVDHRTSHAHTKSKVGTAAGLNGTSDDASVTTERKEEEEEGTKEERPGTTVTEEETGGGRETDEAAENAIGNITIETRTFPKKTHHRHKGRRHENSYIFSETHAGSHTPVHRPHRCLKDCEEAEAGFHQSCKGCRYYLLCTVHKVPRHVKCPGRKVWDDLRKTCLHRSLTCRSSGKVVDVEKP